jgi:hypothetical protein
MTVLARGVCVCNARLADNQYFFWPAALWESKVRDNVFEN